MEDLVAGTPGPEAGSVDVDFDGAGHARLGADGLSRGELAEEAGLVLVESEG